MTKQVILCDHLCAGYGDITVVRDLNLQVSEGEIVLLLGPNGAGKTTTLLTMAGLIPKLNGDVIVCGEHVDSDRPHTMPRRGLAFVPDHRALVSQLSVRDNLRVAARKGGRDVDEVLDLFPALRPRLNITSGRLSGGEQQMLAMGRALMLEPKVLIVDEMSMGLAPIIVQHLMEIIQTIASESGAGVLLVEQHVALALEAADRAYVLVHGDITLRASAAELRSAPEKLTNAYLGLHGEHLGVADEAQGSLLIAAEAD